MKKVTKIMMAMLAAAFIALTGCQKEATLSLDPVTVNVVADGANEMTFTTVTTNTSWVATVDGAWITLTTSSGDAASTSVVGTVAANTEAQTRSAVITVKAGDKSSTITVTQDAADPWKGTDITAMTGDLKLGTDITVEGTGWDESKDYLIACAGTDSVYITTDEISFKSKKIVFGMSPSEAIGGSSNGKLILVRGNLRKEIGTNLKFIVPTIEEGWLPEAAFRTLLKSVDNNIANMFDKYDMLDVETAGSYTSNGATLFMTDSGCVGFEGISLFHSLNGRIYAWSNPNLEKVDASGLHALIEIRFPNCKKLTELIFSDGIQETTINGTTALVSEDLHEAAKLVRYNANEGGDGARYQFVDFRRAPSSPAWTGEVYILFDDNAKVKMTNNEWTYNWFDGHASRYGGQSAIINAWMTQNLTIEIYKDDDMDSLLYSVPAYSSDPNFFMTKYGFDLTTCINQ
jgi:hypothetical protein